MLLVIDAVMWVNIMDCHSVLSTSAESDYPTVGRH